MRNGRCRMHGGKSTGPRTAAGLLNRTVAMRILPDTLAADQFRERFDSSQQAMTTRASSVPRSVSMVGRNINGSDKNGLFFVVQLEG
jgi:hypothetical protein